MADIPAFHRSLTAFKKRLSTTDEETFALTTFEDLKTTVKDIQQEQAQRRGYRNLAKIKPFLVTLQQYALVIEQFVNAKSDFLAFIWGPIKLCLQIASRLAEAFDWLLDAYARIGESLPVFSAVDNLFSFHRQDYVEQILANVYEDILSFHQRAVVFFKQSTWTIAFKTTFRTFNDLFGDVAKNLQRSKELLIQSASVTHFQEAQDARLLLTQECNAQMERHEQHQRLAVVSWLSHTPCGFLHAEFQDTRHKYPDTTRWVFDTVQMSEWLRKDDPSSPILWLCGIPGAGKTILFSSITDHIKTNYPNAQVIYFYCKEKDPVRDNFVDVARSLITQILELNPICIHYLYDKALNSVERSLSSMVTCTEILSDLVLHHRQLFIGIDGLDECEELERSRILAMLHRLLGASKAKSNVQMFLASRKEMDIGRSLESANRLEIRPFHLKMDINSYVRVQVGALAKRFDLPAERQKHIVTEITMRAHGMFLLARLIMDNLLDQICHEDLEEELRSEILPKGINQAYGRILFRMQKREHSTRRSEVSKLGLDVLTMIKRPIKVREIQAVLSIRLEDKSIDLIKRRSTIPIAELLGPMVEVHADNSVNFIHSTAREYLLQYHSEHYVDPRVAELRLARLCTSYLTFQCFDPFLSDSGIEDAVRRGDYAFQEYATFNWIRHVDSLENHSDPGICDGMSSMRDSIAHLYSNHINEHTEYVSVSDSDMTGHDNPSFAQQLEALRSLYDSVDTIHCNEGIQDLKPYLLLRLVKVRAALEGLSPKELKLIPLVTEAYGESLYKCPVICCNRFCRGFANGKDRDEHVKRHERAHKCTHEGCDYSELGFPTSSELTRHICLCHSVYPDELAFPSVRRVSNSQALKDAIDRDDAVAVREICGKLSSRASSETGFVLRAVKRRSITAAMVLVELLGYAEEMDHKDKKGATALHEAIAIDHRDLINRILNTDVNVNAPDRKANTPLILALEHGKLEAARLLLNHHAIDLKPPTRRNVLGLYEIGIEKAASSGDDDILRAIFETMMEQWGRFAISEGISTRYWGNVIRQALVSAARYWHESTIKLILELWRKFGPEKQFLEPIRKEVSPGTDAALRAAMKHENIPMIQLLLEEGADINAEGGEEGSALSLACARGHTDIIRLLLEEGAFIDIKTKNPYRPLLEASSHGHQDIVQLLIEHEANVNAYDGSGNTALHKASTTGQKDVVILLLEKGADLQMKDYCGQTALQRASAAGQKDVVTLLLEKGAIDLRDGNGDTALQRASAAGQKDVVTLLLEKGAGIGLRDRCQRTALHRASAAGQTDVVMLLLENGADLQMKDYCGQTALHRASAAGSKAVAILLLEKGADINLRDGKGSTALHEASRFGDKAIVKFLLDNGADLTLQDEQQRNALYEASHVGSEDVVQLLLERATDVELPGGVYDVALNKACYAQGYDFPGKSSAQRLLEKGATFDIPLEIYNRALKTAHESRGYYADTFHKDVMQLLRKKGARLE